MSSRFVAAACLLFALLALLRYEARAQAEPGPRDPDVRLEFADRSLLSRIVEESGADTSVPRPGTIAYLAELGRRFTRGALRALAPAGELAGVLAVAFGHVAGVFVVLVAAFLLFLVGRLVYRRYHRLGRRPEVEDPDVIPQAPAAPRIVSAAGWQEELFRRLEQADVASALEALWWWLARSLLGSRVRASWTSGDLLANAKRAGLAEPVRALERMMYGSRRPSVDEVRELARSIEEQLA